MCHLKSSDDDTDGLSGEWLTDGSHFLQEEFIIGYCHINLLIHELKKVNRQTGSRAYNDGQTNADLLIVHGRQYETLFYYHAD